MLNVLVPIDGSENALRALRHLISPASICRAPGQIYLLNVQPPVASGVVRLFLSREDLSGYYREESEKALAPARQELEKAGVPSGPINDFSQVFNDPHVQSRGMRVKVNHPFESELSLIRNAITFSGTPVKDYRAPPLLGADTKDVLATIGYDEAKLEKLKAQKII